MAVGKAIVTSDLPSVREVIEPGVHALTAQPEDAESFAQAIHTLLADADLRARLGAAARARVEAFTWTTRAGRIVDLIASVKATHRDAGVG
jgi:glycosyltransferase involved in cell wall biosynthesis